jgi:protein TonB
MEANKILSADILDLLFDNRNKDYGAYELRVTYPKRVKRSLIIVFSIAAVAITGVALGNSFKAPKDERIMTKEVTIQTLPPDEKPLPPPPPQPPPPAIPQRTVAFTNPVIVPEDVDPPPTQADIADAKIDTKSQDGVIDDKTIQAPEDLNKGTGIIEDKKDDDDVSRAWVEVPAKYDGDWIKFLTINLNGQVPNDNGAPAGRYNVMIQFVVDKQGNVSDITPLTNLGYGMEQEAVRVLKKAKKWKPGIQNGHEVKCYHKQPITFVVEDGN